MAKTTKSKAPKSTQMDLAALVSARVQILELYLTDSVVRRGSIRSDRLPGIVEMSVQVKSKAHRKENLITVRPRFTLRARYESAVENESLQIDAAFMIHYAIPSFDGIEKSHIDAFGELNGVYNAWPYWREFVQAATVRMALPPLTVPVHRPTNTSTSGGKPHSTSSSETYSTAEGKPRRRSPDRSRSGS
jgi:hypothetical protein